MGEDREGGASRPAPDEASDRRADDGISSRPLVWVGFVTLLLLAIPWYLPAAAETLVLGLPLWVSLCLSANLALAIYTTWVIRRYWGNADG